MSNPDGTGQSILFSVVSTAIGVDDARQKIYSEDRFSGARGSIVRSNFDGTSFEIVIEDVPKASGIAIDPINEYVFWTSSAGLSDGNGGVYRIDFDGTDFQELFVQGSSLDTNGIALDIENGLVYWGQETASNRSDIYRMGLNGSNPDVFSTGYGNITDLVFLVPEPATFGKLSAGLLRLGVMRRNLKKVYGQYVSDVRGVQKRKSPEIRGF